MTMLRSIQPLHFLLTLLAGWVNRQQTEVIEYLKAENRLLKERLGGRRLRFTDAERRRLARRAHALGRKALIVAVDGSKFKAVNNRDKNFTDRKLEARLQQLEESIGRYLSDLDRADRDPTLVTEARVEHLKRKIELVKAQMQELRAVGEQLKQYPDGQISLTDPDARSMATSGRGTGMVGYNVQAAVDAKHHMIVAHEVTNIGHDRTQLASMSKQAREAMRTEELTVLADRGYFKGEEILACDRLGINALVPKPQTSNNQAKGQFDKRHFRFVAADDHYECPAGQRAIRRFATVEDGMTIYKYWSSACPACPLRAKCTNGKYRRITRWEHEHVLEAMQARLVRMPQASLILWYAKIRSRPLEWSTVVTMA